MIAMAVPSYDVFLSYRRSGRDLDTARRIYSQLSDAGMNVFVDHRGIAEFDSITARVQSALANSKVLLVLYSMHYNESESCQYELTYALAAVGRREQPSDRILVINPERDRQHIGPAALMDELSFAFPRTPAKWNRFVEYVSNRVERVSIPLGELGDHAPDQLPQRLYPARAFHGRYRDLLDLHSALTSDEHPGILGPENSSVVAIHARAGMGKTALAESYVLRFSSYYPGGVYWFGSFAASTGRKRWLRSYNVQLAGLAARLGIGIDGGRRECLDRISEQLTRQGSQYLWVVDGFPPELRSEDLAELLPSSAMANTIFTVRRTLPSNRITHIKLGPLSVNARRQLVDSLTAGLGLSAFEVRYACMRSDGSPRRTRLVARALARERGAATADSIIDRALSRADRKLMQQSELVLRAVKPGLRPVIATLCELPSLPLSASLVESVVREVLGPARIDPKSMKRVMAALHVLWDDDLVSRDEDGRWVFPGDAARAMRRALPAADRRPARRHAAAAVEELVHNADSMARSDVGYLVRHARGLLHGSDLPDDISLRLSSVLAQKYPDLGDARDPELDRPSPWGLLESRKVHAGKWFEVWIDDVVTPEGCLTEYHRVRSPGSVAVIAIDERDRVAMTTQWVYTHGEFQWRLPGGGIDPVDESPEAAAHRELLEETGIDARHLQFLARISGGDSFSDHVDHIFWASGLTEGEQDLGVGEGDLAVHWLPFSEVWMLLDRGKIRHAPSAHAVALVALMRNWDLTGAV